MPFYLSKSDWLYFSLWSPSLRSSSTNPARLTTSYVGMSKFSFRRAGGGGGAQLTYNTLSLHNYEYYVKHVSFLSQVP